MWLYSYQGRKSLLLELYTLFLAVDRSVSATLSDARDALVNAVIDSLSAYRSSVLSIQQPGLMAPYSLRLFPLYVLALLKQVRVKRKLCERMNVCLACQLQVKGHFFDVQNSIYFLFQYFCRTQRWELPWFKFLWNQHSCSLPALRTVLLAQIKFSRDNNSISLRPRIWWLERAM